MTKTGLCSVRYLCIDSSKKCKIVEYSAIGVGNPKTGSNIFHTVNSMPAFVKSQFPMCWHGVAYLLSTNISLGKYSSQWK